jgi:prepilin-type N-terminal cleavage/methylation domain-containing protein
MKRSLGKGFTIVELILVVVVIAILATISIFAISSWRTRIATTELNNALIAAASAMKSEKNFGSGYPATFPTSYTSASSNSVVLELASSSASAYCINGYSKAAPEEQMSVSSSYTTPRSGLCPSTSPTAPLIGGTIPDAPTGKDLAPPLSTWTLAGGATYSATNGIVLGAAGTATSPTIRVKGAGTVATISGMFYATTQSPYATHQPNGGWHGGIYYYGNDATTSVVNSANNYASNGATQAIALNTWGPGITYNPYSWGIGSNVYYVKMTLTGSNGGYASPDLKIKSISLVMQ